MLIGFSTMFNKYAIDNRIKNDPNSAKDTTISIYLNTIPKNAIKKDVKNTIVLYTTDFRPKFANI